MEKKEFKDGQEFIKIVSDIDKSPEQIERMNKHVYEGKPRPANRFKGKELSPDFLVMAEIHKAEQSNEPIGFTDIVNIFDGQIDRIKISLADDRLSDLGITYTKWIKNGGSWKTCFFLYSEHHKMAEEIINFQNSDSE